MNRMTGYTSSKTYKSLEDIQRDSSELCLCYCGWEQCEPGHRYGPNRRRNYVLHFVSKGSGKLEVNGNQYHIKKERPFCSHLLQKPGMKPIKRIPGSIAGWDLLDQKQKPAWITPVFL